MPCCSAHDFHSPSSDATRIQSSHIDAEIWLETHAGTFPFQETLPNSCTGGNADQYALLIVTCTYKKGKNDASGLC